MIRIFLLRHGETTWNVEGRYQGQEDTPLSEKGIAQGKAAAKALKDIPLDRIIASPLSRAVDTANFTAALHHMPVITDERLTEISHGRWEGVYADAIKKTYPKEFALWHEAPHKVQMPGGEALRDVEKRAASALSDYVTQCNRKTILLCAHDAVNKVILCHILGLPLSSFWQFKQDNACINCIEYDKKRWRLVTMNHTAHLGFLVSGTDQKGL